MNITNRIPSFSRLAASGAALAMAMFPLSCTHAGWQLEVLPGTWSMTGFENSLDLSGIAAASGSHCLVGSDESFYIQPGVIERETRRIRAQRPIPLPIESDSRKPEIDIEGVAFSLKDQAYYVVGSHGVGKKKADFQPERHSVYKVPVHHSDGAIRQREIQRASLLPWLERTPALAPFVKRQLQQNGLNIEGLACAGDKLFFGLRAPNKGGRALVIEVCPARIFSGPPEPLVVHELLIAEGRGIREIAAVRDGFLLLTGNASAEASKKIPVTLAPGPDNRFELLHWNGRDSRPVRIAVLPATGGKAEGLLVMADTPQQVEVLVIFDGLADGRPLALRARRSR